MKEYSEGLVSIIIPTYKRAELLKRSIDTSLAQTYKNIELLIVNDNNKDDEYSKALYELIGTYHDPRLRLIEQEKHINGAVARNIGLKNALGEYVAFQDDDDYWEPKKIEIQVDILKKLDKTWGAVGCLMRFYNNGKLIRSCLPYRDGYILEDILSLRTGLGTGALLIRRSALDDVGYFDEKLLRHQDLQLFANLTEKYKIKLVKRYLHNRETKDNQNRPNIKQLEVIKNSYFESISTIMEKLPKNKQKKIIIMHIFDTANTYKKYGDYKKFVKNSIIVFKYFETIKLAFFKLMKRLIETRFKYFLQNIY